MSCSSRYRKSTRAFAKSQTRPTIILGIYVEAKQMTEENSAANRALRRAARSQKIGPPPRGPFFCHRAARHGARLAAEFSAVISFAST
jgi:hypothetical protein